MDNTIISDVFGVAGGLPWIWNKFDQNLLLCLRLYVCMTQNKEVLSWLHQNFLLVVTRRWISLHYSWTSEEMDETLHEIAFFSTYIHLRKTPDHSLLGSHQNLRHFADLTRSLSLSCSKNLTTILEGFVHFSRDPWPRVLRWVETRCCTITEPKWWPNWQIVIASGILVASTWKTGSTYY